MSSAIYKPQTRTGSTRSKSRPRAGRTGVLKLHTLKRQFILHASLILLLAAILMLVSSTTLSRASADLATIDSGSIPSVDAAQQITQLIEVIDAQAADYLATASLTSTIPCTITGLKTTSTLTTHTCDERNIDAETVLVNQTLFQAEHNVTYTGERTAVERITIGLESYLEDIHQMRVDFGLAAHKTDPTDSSLQQAYQAYLHASGILHDQITLATLDAGQIPIDKEANLPGCTLPNRQVLSPDQWTQGGLTIALDCLSSINYAHLQSAYTDSGNFLDNSIAWLSALSLVLGLLLVSGTVRMILTSHRLINPGLLTATLLSLIFSFTCLGLLSSLQGTGSTPAQDGAFRQLVQDDYASIYAAALLQRYGTDSNADESRWLIAQEFNDQANMTHWQNDWNQNVQQTQFLIRQAHVNQTWQEEIAPLQNIDTSWQEYKTFDGQIRGTAEQQNNPQRLLQAEIISTGPSNQVFNRFSDAVTNLAQANHTHYQQTFDAVNGSLTLYFWLSLVLFPLAGLLAFWGVTLRLKDF